MITLFLGAGASKPFGYPTTADFIQISNEKFRSNPLYSEIVTFFGGHEIDIELILWELDKLINGIDNINEAETFKKWFLVDSNRTTYNLRGTNYQLRDAMGQTKADAINLKSSLNRLVYDTYWKEPDETVNTFYDTLFKRIDLLPGYSNSKKRDINIFTTNYDLIIERFFELKRPIFSDGFAPDTRRSYCWNFSNYGDHKFKLFKLHGSIDWKISPSDGKVCCVPMHDFTKHEDNVILYPGFKGEPEIEPFKTLHRAFADSLISATMCIFIGFSFRDEYINKIISESMMQNPHLAICTWNPSNITLPFETHNHSGFLKNFGVELEDCKEFFDHVKDLLEAK